jgi:hypothetical protein
MARRKRYRVWVWSTATDELRPGQRALIVEGPDIGGTTARDRELALFIEVTLNAALAAFAPKRGA